MTLDTPVFQGVLASPQAVPKVRAISPKGGDLRAIFAEARVRRSRLSLIATRSSRETAFLISIEIYENITRTCCASPPKGRRRMFFRFPPDSRWNAERSAVEFGIGVGEYEGIVRIPVDPAFRLRSQSMFIAQRRSKHCSISLTPGE